MDEHTKACVGTRLLAIRIEPLYKVNNSVWPEWVRKHINNQAIYLPNLVFRRDLSQRLLLESYRDINH